ncbi:Arcn1 [Symbiodinium natans]|uniref:Coatomer subunit delta n=1 Tax=Symbiodinium natans TaxID=878477 RepID=A0A812Q4B9_9DINO|nr:Arcn1 [Symbiodinium natans]
MVVLSAAIVKKDKTLVARQFVEMTRLRIEAAHLVRDFGLVRVQSLPGEGLLGAFTKLVDSGKDHTFVRGPWSVRYVYQPMEALNLVVITNKASNILEDLETLRLLAKVVQDCCEIQVSEENVLKHAFDIVFAFDEVISFGYRESVTLSQIKTYTEMDSHEERLHMMVEQSKINEAREMAKKKQMELARLSFAAHLLVAKQRALQPKDAAGPGFGSRGGSSFQDTMPSMGGASFGNDSTAPWSSSMVEDSGPAPLKPGAPKKGMALGKKKNADVLGSMGIPEPTPSVEAVAEEPAAAPAYNPLMDPVRVDIEEKITADLQVEGGLEGEAVCTGQFQVTVLDASKADLAAFRLAPQNQEFRYKIHPNLNKTSHANNVLEVREASRAYRANAPVPLVKWQSGAQLADDQNQTAEPQSWPGF